MTRDHRGRWPRNAAAPSSLAVGSSRAPPSRHPGLSPRRVRWEGLPLSLTPAAPGPLLAVLLTGDGGWAAGDKSMAQALAQRGVAVVGLNSARYVDRARTPDEAASDLARIVRHFLGAWHRQRVVLIGYSRGAEPGPVHGVAAARRPAGQRWC